MPNDPRPRTHDTRPRTRDPGLGGPWSQAPRLVPVLFGVGSHHHPIHLPVRHVALQASPPLVSLNISAHAPPVAHQRRAFPRLCPYIVIPLQPGGGRVSAGADTKGRGGPALNLRSVGGSPDKPLEDRWLPEPKAERAKAARSLMHLALYGTHAKTNTTVQMRLPVPRDPGLQKTTT